MLLCSDPFILTLSCTSCFLNVSRPAKNRWLTPFTPGDEFAFLIQFHSGVSHLCPAIRLLWTAALIASSWKSLNSSERLWWRYCGSFSFSSPHDVITPHPAPLMSRCQIENTETVNLRGSEGIIQQQLSRYCCHRDQRYVQRFLSPCNDASSRACFWTPVTTAGRSQSQHLTWWPHSCLCVAWREGWSVCFRLTSNLPMEAVVWLVCITSVRAHICWILDDTVWGSGRPWRQTGGRMSSRGRAEGQTTS